jgi:iron complex outermembrane receptor protein
MTTHTPSTRTRQLKPLSLACALISAPMLSLPVFSADAPAIEEVIVTASKRGQSLQDFAGAASVITNFDGVKSIGDIANQVPGFSIVDAGPRNPTGLVIRGLRMDEVSANDLGGDGAMVSSYVDNIPLQGYFAPPGFSLKDLQQVEVLRGPQGTLYGNSSIGGLIRYVTAKPDLSKSSVRVGAEISQTDHSGDLNYDTDLVVNTPLLDNTLGLRVMLGKTENAGFIDNPYLLGGAQDDINDDRARQVRLSLLWQATDNFSLNGSYHYQKINVGDRQAANESFTGDEYTAASQYLQPMQGELQLASIDATYEMAWATLTASVNRYDYQHKERADQTDFLATLYGPYYTDYDDFSAYTTTGFSVVKDSLEVRLASSEEQRLRWLIGGFYSRDDLDLYNADYVPGFAAFSEEADRPNDLDYSSSQTEILDEYAAYAEIEYDLTEKWEASLGARYFRYDDDLDVCLTVYGDTRYDYCELGDDVSSDTLGSFKTRYKFSAQHTLYFVLAEGYRRGGANLAPMQIADGQFYRSDSAVSAELGLRSNWFAEKLQLNAALFNVDWDNLQIKATSDSGFPVFVNAGEARSQGVELDLSAQLNGSFRLRAGYSYSDAKIIETVTFTQIDATNAYDGDQLPGAPRTQWSLSLDYAESFASADVDASIGLNRFGQIYTALNSDFYNYQKLDSFTTVNARVGVTRRNWRLGAFVNNIENTRGITGKRSDEMHGERGQFEYVTRPRTVGLSVDYQY